VRERAREREGGREGGREREGQRQRQRREQGGSEIVGRGGTGGEGEGGVKMCQSDGVDMTYVSPIYL
jgi:hypothetical protein